MRLMAGFETLGDDDRNVGSSASAPVRRHCLFGLGTGRQMAGIWMYTQIAINNIFVYCLVLCMY